MPKVEIVEYQAAVRACVLAAGLIGQHDLDKLLAAIDWCHSVGPILDQTLYRSKAEAMEQDRELLKAALPLLRWIEARKVAG